MILACAVLCCAALPSEAPATPAVKLAMLADPAAGHTQHKKAGPHICSTDTLQLPLPTWCHVHHEAILCVTGAFHAGRHVNLGNNTCSLTVCSSQH
jgi:hypothetical protein